MQEKITTSAVEKITISTIVRFLFWSLISGMTLYFIAGHFIKYFTKGIPDFFGDTLWNKRLWFYIHITGGALAIIIGPLQFWKRIRIRYVRFHRTAGKLYIIGSIMAVIGLVRILPEGLCVACRPSQFVVTALWLLCTIAAWITIKRRNIKAHRQFMARSYLFAFYFVAVRVLGELEKTVFSFVKKDSAWYANTDWFVWVVPLIILEIYHGWWPSMNMKLKIKSSVGKHDVFFLPIEATINFMSRTNHKKKSTAIYFRRFVVDKKREIRFILKFMRLFIRVQPSLKTFA